MKTFLLITVVAIFLISINYINKKYNILPMKGKYKRIKILVATLLIITCVLYISGYRFNSLSAARANSFIDKDMILMDELHSQWADIYFFYDESEDKYHTAISEKRFFLYRSSNSVWLYNHADDPMKTIGSVSYINRNGKSIVALLIQSLTDDVDYIEAKLGNDVFTEKMTNGKSVIISFENSHLIHELELKAFDNNDKELYYYGYPKDTSYLKGEDYKWHVSEE